MCCVEGNRLSLPKDKTQLMHTETVKQQLLLKNTVVVAKAAACCSCLSQSCTYSFMVCVAGECKADK